DDGKVLIAPCYADLPGAFEIRSADDLNGSHASAHDFPESLGCTAMDMMMQQCPGLDQNMVGGDQRLAASENYLGPCVASIGRVRGGVPDGGIDEETHLAPALAAGTSGAGGSEGLRNHRLLIPGDVGATGPAEVEYQLRVGLSWDTAQIARYEVANILGQRDTQIAGPLTY